jgi:hypothetical protein
MLVRILPSQPDSLEAEENDPQRTEKPAVGGLLQSGAGLSTPKLENAQAVSGKVSGYYREYSRFRETFTGDAVRSALRAAGGSRFRWLLRP